MSSSPLPSFFFPSGTKTLGPQLEPVGVCTSRFDGQLDVCRREPVSVIPCMRMMESKRHSDKQETKFESFWYWGDGTVCWSGRTKGVGKEVERMEWRASWLVGWVDGWMVKEAEEVQSTGMVRMRTNPAIHTVAAAHCALTWIFLLFQFSWLVEIVSCSSQAC